MQPLRFDCKWVSGVPDGEAVVSHASGDRYEGTYVAYTRRGQGVMNYCDGSKCGLRPPENPPLFQPACPRLPAQCHATPNLLRICSIDLAVSCRHKGAAFTATRCCCARYVGEWQKSKRHGQGILTSISGDKYEARAAPSLLAGAGVDARRRCIRMQSAVFLGRHLISH